jgi:hypothetical protein
MTIIILVFMGQNVLTVAVAVATVKMSNAELMEIIRYAIGE